MHDIIEQLKAFAASMPLCAGFALGLVVGAVVF